MSRYLLIKPLPQYQDFEWQLSFNKEFPPGTVLEIKETYLGWEIMHCTHNYRIPKKKLRECFKCLDTSA